MTTNMNAAEILREAAYEEGYKAGKAAGKQACSKCALSRNKQEVPDTVSTPDVVEVVRCKNCRLSEEMEGLIGGTCLYCTHWNHNVDPTGFCSEGV